MKIKVLISIFLIASMLLVTGCKDAEEDENNAKSDVQAEEVLTPNETDTTELDSSDPEAAESEEVLVVKPGKIWPEKVDPNETEPEPEPTEPEPTEPELTEPETTEPEPTEPEHIMVTDIKLTTYDVTLNVGEKKMPIVTMYPQNAPDKGEIWTSSDESVATVDYLGNIKAVSAGTCTVTVTSTDNKNVSATVNVTVNAKPEPVVDTESEVTECTYIDGILIVNKTYPLPADYAPGWETEATPYLWKMIEAAKADGITLWMKSGYRSYYDQQYIYNNYVKRDGQAEADTYSARPGHSEHQTGLAYDLNSTSNDFADTAEAKWIAENCYKYGFILRYPKGKEEITGYIYEPWHVRYLGVEKATEVYESGLCLEEFLNITSVYAE